MAFDYSDFLFSLFESAEGLTPFAFHVKYKASPYEVSTFIVEGLGKQVLCFDFETKKISLSPKGRNEALKAYYNKINKRQESKIEIPLVYLDNSQSAEKPHKLTIDDSDLRIKRREGTSIEETSRFRFRVKAE